MSKTTKHALGRGLNAIFGSSESQYAATNEVETVTPATSSGPEDLKVKDIKANPFQPRKVFDADKLEELVSSIKEHGIIQPLIARKKGTGYELVAGERRLRAAKAAGLATVPVIVKEYTDQEMMELALVENIQRHNLNPIEEAEGIQYLINSYALTQEAAAEKVGRSRAAVANILRLLHLPESIRKDVAEEKLTMGQVKPLLSLGDEEQQLQVAQDIKAGDWSARLVEEVVKALKEGRKVKVEEKHVEVLNEETAPVKPPKKPKTVPEPDVHHKVFEDSLVAFLGTKVRVVPKNAKQGRIEIEYYSEDDLGRIYDLLQGQDSVAAAPSQRVKGKHRDFTV